MYRISSPEGVELATVTASTLIEAATTRAALDAPLSAQITRASGAKRIFARKELWLGEYPGWSVVVVIESQSRGG